MAANLDPQQLEALARALDELNRSSSGISRSFDEAEGGVTAGGKAMFMAADAASKLAKGMLASASAVYDGQKGLKTFDSAVDGAADALMVLTGALALLGGPLTMVAAGLTAVIAAGAKYVKAANDQSDKLYDAYSQMAQAGAAAGDGMQGLYRDVKRLGGGISDLGDFVAMVSASGQDLAGFAGTVGKGRQEFARVSQALKPYRESMLQAGITQKEQNEGTLAYIRLQSRIGQAQNMTTQQLAEGAHKYLVEQDALTKITGMTRQQQEDALNKARNRETFAATLLEMRSKGDKKSQDAARELEKTIVSLTKYGSDYSDGLADLATGNINSAEAQKLYNKTQGEALVIADKLKNGEISQGEAMDQLARAVKRNTDTFGVTQGKLNNLAGFTGSLADDLRFTGDAAKGFKKQLDAAGQAQKEQGLFGDKALDDELATQAKTRLSQVSAQQSMQDFVRYGAGPATKATSYFARGLEFVTKLLPGTGTLRKEMDLEKGVFDAEDKLSAAAAKLADVQAEFEAAADDEKEAAKKKLETAKEEFKTAKKDRDEKKKLYEEFKNPPPPPPPPPRKDKPVAPTGVGAKAGLTAEEAKAALEAGSKRDIEALGGRARLEAIASGKAPPAGGGAGAGAAAPAAPGGGGATSAGGGGASSSKGGGGAAAPAATSGGGGAASAAGEATTPSPPTTGAAPSAPDTGKGDQKAYVDPATLDVIIGDQRRKGGTVSWRTNNPGNISFAGITKKHGALAPFINPKGDDQQRSVGIAIMPNYDAGVEAKMELWRRPMYNNRSIDEGVNVWTGQNAGLGSNYAKDMAKAAGVELGTLIRDLDDSQLKRMVKAQEKWEGFKEGTVVQAADGGAFSGPKTGYPATLHGDEAVIPLKNGSVPVTLNGNQEMIETMKTMSEELKSAMAQITQYMAQSQNNSVPVETLEVLRNIEIAARNSNDIQDKMLREAQN